MENSRIIFMIYLRMCIKGQALAACPDAISFSAPLTSKLEDAVYDMLLTLACKLAKQHNFTQPSFLLGDIEIVTKESKALSSEHIRFKDIFPSMRTFGKYFESLKMANKLSAADIQRHSISLKLTVFNKMADGESTSTEDSDEEIVDGVGQHKGKHKKRDSNSSNKRSHMDTDLDNDQDVSELHSDVEPTRVTRSVTARQKKLGMTLLYFL
ncbi:hypothetical protein M422DRAFT_256298 [Sphaerobolus stellatus SS14]|uniref:Uncharacterized protein n=1 Tax=Sphaerobolus stellatus (strain SS14) TaxID=990650 RepID=A0A0C9VS60_SPHS4|nr:hypothetical protein M422DRAFT_256298 [Sphaerobolus stellatus SS14]